MMITAVFLV